MDKLVNNLQNYFLELSKNYLYICIMETTQTIYKTQKVNSINTITCEIEKTFLDNFSILIYDEEGEIWIEKFADTYLQSVEIADKLFLSVCKKY